MNFIHISPTCIYFERTDKYKGVMHNLLYVCKCERETVYACSCVFLLQLLISDALLPPQLSFPHLSQHGLDLLLHLIQAFVWSSVSPRESLVQLGRLQLEVWTHRRTERLLWGHHRWTHSIRAVWALKREIQPRLDSLIFSKRENIISMYPSVHPSIKNIIAYRVIMVYMLANSSDSEHSLSVLILFLTMCHWKVCSKWRGRSSFWSHCVCVWSQFHGPNRKTHKITPFDLHSCWETDTHTHTIRF